MKIVQQFSRKDKNFNVNSEQRAMCRLKFTLILIIITICVEKTVPSSEYAQIYELHNSFCTVAVSHLNTRYVPYEETYRHKVLGIFYKTKTRINYKVEYYTDWRTEQHCCPGYAEDGIRCQPICSPKCVNGMCRKPNTCECSPHYTKSRGAAAQDHVCVPICTNECLNGKCVLPDTCSCDEGYWMDSDGFTCKPTCEPDCENRHGYCVAPNTCSCHPGYTVSQSSIERVWNASGKTKCEPYCGVSGCEHGTCVAPNKCECNDGYEPFTQNPQDPAELIKCVPKCHGSCSNGDCVAPETCLCHHGYKWNDKNECAPFCGKPCINGVCAKPEVCVCDEGFAHEFAKDPHQCFPVCEKKCVRGICIAPNTCECLDGDILVNDTLEYRCEPVCDVPCGPHGYCHKRNTCQCNEGYQLASPDKKSQEENTSLCEPICKDPCAPNSSCTAPNNCTCDTGYEPSANDMEKLTCQAVCEISCGNGTCVSPNTCNCDEGYETNGIGACVPICSPSCANGTCVEPNVCRCDDGFVLGNDTSSCEPFCENCENGDCIAPYKCRCYDGFIEDGNVTNTGCIEACTRKCSGHGVCVSKGNPCECVHGWSGWDCDEATMCMIKIHENDVNRERIQIVNEINGTQTDMYTGVPYCNECANSLDNETICFDFLPVSGKEDSAITCYLSTGLPCYGAHKYDTVSNDSKLSGSITAAAIVFIVLGVTLAAYLGYRRYHNRHPPAKDPQGSSLQGPAVTESLISEEAVYL